MHAIFDVGANDGSWGLDVAKRFPHVQVFGFEPTPQLCALIHSKVTAEGIRNYELVQKAVSDVPGRVSFNVAGQADWGCSSLLAFNEGLDKTWPGRSDFKVTEVIEVDCIRLDDFIEQRGVTSIEFLHCDTQGADLKVLASMGEHLMKIRMGEIETASSRSVALYKGQHTIEDVVLFFHRHGLEIARITANDVYCNELNVTFQKATEPELADVEADEGVVS